MKLKNIYKLSHNRVVHKFGSCIATLCLCALAFVLFILSIFIYQIINRGRNTCETVLSNGINCTGIIQLKDFDYEHKEEVKAFVRDVNKLKELEGIGTSVSGGSNDYCLYPLTQKQAEIEGCEDNVFHMIYVNREGVDVCKLELEMGLLPDSYGYQENRILLYLGNEFVDIPIGTQYEVKDNNGNIRCVFCVAGILKKGSKWISEDVIAEDGLFDAKYIEMLDHQGLAIVDDIISSNLMYNVKEGYDIRDAEKKIHKVAEKNNLQMDNIAFSDMISEKELYHKQIFENVKIMLIFVFVTVFMMMLCMQMEEMLLDTYYFGILYANGASTKDIVFILLGENLIKIIISFICAIFISYNIVESVFSKFQVGIQYKEMIREVYWRHSVVTPFFLGCIVALLASCIPVLWICHKPVINVIVD